MLWDLGVFWVLGHNMLLCLLVTGVMEEGMWGRGEMWRVMAVTM